MGSSPAGASGGAPAGTAESVLAVPAESRAAPEDSLPVVLAVPAAPAVLPAPAVPVVPTVPPAVGPLPEAAAASAAEGLAVVGSPAVSAVACVGEPDTVVSCRLVGCGPPIMVLVAVVEIAVVEASPVDAPEDPPAGAGCPEDGALAVVERPAGDSSPPAALSLGDAVPRALGEPATAAAGTWWAAADAVWAAATVSVWTLVGRRPPVGFCWWPSAGAVRAECSSALAKSGPPGGAPGGALPPGGGEAMEAEAKDVGAGAVMRARPRERRGTRRWKRQVARPRERRGTASGGRRRRSRAPCLRTPGFRRREGLRRTG